AARPAGAGDAGGAMLAPALEQLDALATACRGPACEVDWLLNACERRHRLEQSTKTDRRYAHLLPVPRRRSTARRVPRVAARGPAVGPRPTARGNASLIARISLPSLLYREARAVGA